MYFYFSSKDSITIYPNNINTDFTVDLQQPIILQNPEEWEIALVELDAPFFTATGGSTKVNYFVLSDMADFSMVAGRNYPVLRRTTVPVETTALANMSGTVYRSNGTVDRTIQLTSTEAADTSRDVQIYDNPFYVTVRQHYIQSIRIYLRSVDFDDLAANIDDLFVTLHLRRKTSIESLESAQKHIGSL